MRAGTIGWRDIVVAAGLLLLVVVLRWSGWSHGFILLDDPAYVLLNPSVREGINAPALRDSLTRIVAGHWHPLAIWSLAANVEIAGLRAGPMVMTNVALHGLNAALVLLVLRRLGFGILASGFGGALFALHPAHVESYAWIAERKDVLSALFFLATLHAWLAWTRFRRPIAYGVALALFILALLAKPMAVTLPVVLVLLEFWPDRPERLAWRQRVAEIVPFLVLSGLASSIALYTQRAGGAMLSASIASPIERIENAIFAWSWSLRTWLVPRGLAVFHPWSDRSPAEIALNIGLLAALTALAFAAWRTRAWCGDGGENGHRRRAVLVGWLWFIAMLFPVSGVVQVGLQSVADRYLYLPGLGLLIAVLAALSCLGEHFSHSTRPALALRGTVGSLAVLWLVLLGMASDGQFSLWRSSEGLLRNAVHVHPESAFAHHLLGVALVDREKWSEAERSLRKAIHLQTGGEILKGRVYETWLPQSLLQLMKVLGRLGRPAEGIEYAEGLIRVAPRNRDAWIELGKLRSAARHGDARAAFERALALDPHSFDAHFSVGALHRLEGRTEESIRALSEAVRLRPERFEARVQLALSLVASQRLTEAVVQLETARELDRAAANRYLHRTAGFQPREDTLDRYIEDIGAKSRE